ncbi:adenylate kinase [Legionella beliardensis]|uniref:Adenylate kinase n=1 Tax=Legionella beliardensis TaxID=91822 RepID=A0A378I035_9GAMM|nr:nucleoside monophosphate kinase [Legionella beliardensis]STX28529.1 adenylate kinase [Legionella beliardensis]
MKIILLAGAPGSGKSTQGSALMAMNLKFKHLALGEVVRGYLDSPNHPITKNYKEFISQGNLLPDDVIKQILQEELAKISDKNSIVLLDGYPRTLAQYDDFKKEWGKPDGLIHLDVNKETLNQRLLERPNSRLDDNQEAIKRRLSFYQDTTKPLLNHIKQELGKNAIVVNTDESVRATSFYLYASLQRLSSIHDVLQKEQVLLKQEEEPSAQIKPIGFTSMLVQCWKTGIEYSSIRAIQADYQTKNFSFSLFNKRVVYLETPAEVKKVLEGNSHLGYVYKHFSTAAGLKYDFLATDPNSENSFKDEHNEVNYWKLIHQGLGKTIKDDGKRIEYLIDKQLMQTFFAEKKFILDTTFDNFFCSFWAEYLFGKACSLERYQENRNQLLGAMKQCFYNNYYKSIDPTGLTSWLYQNPVSNQLQGVKKTLQAFIAKAGSDAMVSRFAENLRELNVKENLDLNEERIKEIVADCTFDLILEPDFLENVMYEALAFAVKENADLHDSLVRNKVYKQGLEQGYLFPFRTRVLDKSVVLDDGSELPAGSMVCLNLKQAGVYHSAGARRCVGQAYTYFFREHFFNCIAPIDFKVKKVSEPLERQASNENVPNSPERYQVSWRLKRNEAMRHMPHHHYKGNKFFDVLSLHQNTNLNALMVKQLTLKINRYIERNNLDWQDVVMAAPEVRGLPIAAQVAGSLQLPLYTIRKKGGYKMAEDALFFASFKKGYGDSDTVELPIEKIKALAGKKVIFLDDGIASGGSAKACIKLLEKQVEGKEPAKVALVLALLQHDYVKSPEKFSEHRLVKTLFDCRAEMPNQELKDEVQALNLP